ncbi:Vacuolar protein sorting-associated protein 17 [Tulasnella sp. 403]|nr:Vacuolar protein sorting-associated protein 17 [Tulasnella sp. 403]
MFDPLNESFATGASSTVAAPWPTTPHNPFADGAILPKPSSPKPPTPEKPATAPPPNPYGKEPQVYGQPGQGLVSPQNNGSTKYDKAEPYLRVRITGLDRNRRDILIRLDAQTNLPNFTGNTYRNVQRSYVEFQRFAEQITYSNPQTIVPALPLPQTSAPTDEEDDRLVRVTIQRWCTRICEDPVLLRDEEVRSFIESDFGYQPTVRAKRKASSGFHLLKRGAPDEDEELVAARLALTRLEGEFFDVAKGASSETVILGDSFGYQGLNARAAKETLQQRTQVLEEYQSAVKASISKRRNIERLKASSNIRPERVDEALEELEEANKYEHLLAKRVDGISQNLHRALHTHSRQTHEDVIHSLVEHARAAILYERQLLRELESLRPDFANINRKVVPQPIAAPRPTLPVAGTGMGGPARTSSAPDFARQPLASNGNGLAGPSGSNGTHPSVQVAIPGPPLGGGPPSGFGPGGRVDGTQSMFVTPSAAYSSLPSTGSPLASQPPLSPQINTSAATAAAAPVSPGFATQRAAFGSQAGPASPPASSAAPPSAVDPLGVQGGYNTSPQRRIEESIHGRPGQHFGGANTLARSMYINKPTAGQPRRLDAREAAAKLANFL